VLKTFTTYFPFKTTLVFLDLGLFFRAHVVLCTPTFKISWLRHWTGWVIFTPQSLLIFSSIVLANLAAVLFLEQRHTAAQLGLQFEISYHESVQWCSQASACIKARPRSAPPLRTHK